MTPCSFDQTRKYYVSLKDRTIEEKYLHNFSPKERELFYQEQRAKWDALARYQGKLNELMFSESKAIFANDEPTVASSPLEIKYVLNRIAANDPRDRAFELGKMDCVVNGDEWAGFIAQSFKNNTHCKMVILNHIGLTDAGLIPILESLKDNELSLLNIAGNKATSKSFQKIDEILSNPQNKWGKVCLGKIKTTPELANSLTKHPKLSFGYVASSLQGTNRFLSCFSRQKS